MRSIFGMTREDGPAVTDMDAVLTRELCENRRALQAMEAYLGEVVNVLREVKDLLQENVEQSQRVSEDLQNSAEALYHEGIRLGEEMSRGRA
jgi:hypothetical protein